jgi:ribosomal protein S18 acetylase RimI-like enzyme
MNDTPATHIVRAGHEHLPLLVPLFDDYRVFYERPSDLDGARDYLSERLSNLESVIFLALSGDGEQGLGFTQLYPSYTSLRMRRLWILYDLYVSPQVRRQGVGRALMAHATEFATATGATRIELSTAMDNRPAQALYESLGYEKDNAFYFYELTL